MRFQNELQATLQQLVESPKTTSVVATATSVAGIASVADLMRGALSIAAIIAGLIATAILARVNWIKYRNERITNLLLRKQAEELGIDLSKEE